MNKLIGSSLAVLALAMTSNATVLLDEPFAYSDGTLTSVSSGAWSAHSGAGAQPVQVSSEKITLITASGSAEDVSRAISPPNAYSAQTLYGSFKVNFSALPTAGTTTYFSHFSQNSSTFRCRVFSTVSGAGSNKFRVGVANSSGTAPVIIPTDLDTGTEYKLVFRLVGGTNATLWIDPTSESSMVKRADGTDSTTLGSYVSTNYSFRQSTGMGTMTIDDLKIGTAFEDVQTVGGPPSISGLVSTNIPANGNTGPMPFDVTDVETPIADLTVAATSSNPTLVPNNPANLTFGGPYTNSTLTVTPAAGQQGTSDIEVVVTDGNGDKATNAFTLSVGLPSISALASQTAPIGTEKIVNFWVNDTETAPGSLTVTATSSDQAVLPDANIGIVNSGGTNRTLLLTNTAVGFTIVTVTVNDTVFTLTNTFTLTATTNNGILLADDFAYTDGSIITNSAANGLYAWYPNTGTTGQTQVASGKLLLSNSGTEDIFRWITNAPAVTNSGQLLFTRLVVNFSALPTASGSGQYFQHIYAQSGQYRARLFATTNGVAPGKFRFRISNGGYDHTAFPQDISTNENHVLITCYNTATAESTLWVDPTSEASVGVTATDPTTSTAVYGVSFRQDSGIGSLSIDDLVVGSTFDQVLLVLPSSNAKLSALALSAGTVDPLFNANSLSYTASVANVTASITVTPTAEDAGATIEARVNGGAYTSVTSGSPSGALPLNVGPNTVDVRVTAADTTTIRVYSVTVTRAPAAPTSEPIIYSMSGSDLILSWTDPAFKLATGTNLTQITNIISTTSPYTNSVAAEPQRYFRLVYP